MAQLSHVRRAEVIMPVGIARRSFIAFLVGPQHIRVSSIAVGAATSLVAFVATLAMMLTLTAWYRDALSDVVASGDATFLCGASFVASAALGGFIAGISSRSTDAIVGGLHAAFVFVTLLVLIALGSGAWRLATGSNPLPMGASALPTFVFVVCAMLGAVIAGRAGARRNAGG